MLHLHAPALSVGRGDSSSPSTSSTAPRRRTRRSCGDYPRLTTDIVASDNSARDPTFEKLEIGENVFPDLPPGLSCPSSPDWVDITAAGSRRRLSCQVSGWEIAPWLAGARPSAKRFGGIVALNKMHFAADAGEVHAILGENGAGKCTFIQILAGAVARRRGSIRLAGAPYRAATRRDAAAAGIAPSSRSCR